MRGFPYKHRLLTRRALHWPGSAPFPVIIILCASRESTAVLYLLGFQVLLCPFCPQGAQAALMQLCALEGVQTAP